MKYETEGSERITHKEETFAQTPREAARLYFDLHGHWPETVLEVQEDEDAEPVVHEVATACEGCMQVVFEGEKYFTGDDFDLCEKCALQK